MEMLWSQCDIYVYDMRRFIQIGVKSNGDIQTRVVEQHKLEIANDVTVLATVYEQVLI